MTELCGPCAWPDPALVLTFAVAVTASVFALWPLVTPALAEAQAATPEYPQGDFHVVPSSGPIGTGVVVAALTKWLSAPAHMVAVPAAVLLFVAGAMTIGTLSFFNACESGVSFPVRGVDC